MITTFFLVYGWIIAGLCGMGWYWTHQQLQRSRAREAGYMQMLAEHEYSLRPSLSALKAARIIPLLIVLLIPSAAHAQTALPRGSFFQPAHCVQWYSDGADRWCHEAARVDLRGSLGALIVGNVLDIASTEYALSQGAREANPVMAFSTPSRLLLKSVGTISSVYLIQKLGQRKPKLAKVLGYTIGGSLSLIAAHNIHQVRTR